MIAINCSIGWLVFSLVHAKTLTTWPNIPSLRSNLLSLAEVSWIWPIRPKYLSCCCSQLIKLKARTGSQLIKLNNALRRIEKQAQVVSLFRVSYFGLNNDRRYLSVLSSYVLADVHASITVLWLGISNTHLDYL